MNRALKFIPVMILLIVAGPVLWRQAFPVEAMTLEGVQLADTTYEEVAFYNDVQDLALAGMLFMPEGDGPFPGVVLIHGNGTSSRNNTWYLSLTHYLQESGIAVLLPDKRGSVNSAGDWRTASYEDLATDTVAAVDYLRLQPDVGAVGIIGLSQGGSYSPVVANLSPDVAFVVNVVGTSLKAHDVLRYEETNNLREMGFLPGISDGFAYLSSLYIIQESQADYWDVVGNFDPLPYWESVDVPALVLYGGDDHNVPASASAERLNSLNRPNISVNIYPNSGHALEDRDTGRYFREDALQDIVDFIESSAT